MTKAFWLPINNAEPENNPPRVFELEDRLVDPAKGGYEAFRTMTGEWGERVQSQPLREMGLAMYVDEVGRLKNLSPNLYATRRLYPDLICGEVLIVSELQTAEDLYIKDMSAVQIGWLQTLVNLVNKHHNM